MAPDKKLLLETRNLRKVFGGLVAVDDVSIKIHEHTLHSIIGPNGAGKTTLFNMISGVLPPTRGNVIYKGRDITHLPTYRIAHQGIGRSFQITNIFPSLTVMENIRLSAQAMGKDNMRLLHLAEHFHQYVHAAEETIALVGLEGKEGQLALNLSHGEKRKLEIGNHAGFKRPTCSFLTSRRRACPVTRCQSYCISLRKSARWVAGPSYWSNTAWIW
jgi:branched-chain amino acid transport system ATP-binding protein